MPSALAYITVAARASSGRAKRYTRPSSSQRTSSTDSPDRLAVSSTVSWRCSRARASADGSPIGSSGSTSSMPVVILLLAMATFHSIGEIDVAWRGQVIARHEGSRQCAQAGVGHLVPRVTSEQQGMQADTAVCGGDAIPGAVLPGRHDAVDRMRIDARPVAEHGDGRLDLGAE